VSLVDLQRALAGEIGFGAALEALAQSLFNGQLPAAWARLNPATEKGLGAWMAWFRRRCAQYRDWVERGEPKVGGVGGGGGACWGAGQLWRGREAWGAAPQLGPSAQLLPARLFA
jgi:hypothetical protein